MSAEAMLDEAPEELEVRDERIGDELRAEVKRLRAMANQQRQEAHDLENRAALLVQAVRDRKWALLENVLLEEDVASLEKNPPELSATYIDGGLTVMAEGLLGSRR